MADDLLDTLERAFAAASYAYQTYTMGTSKRVLRVVEAIGSPDPEITTYLSYDGALVDSWQGVRHGRRLLPIVPVLRPKDSDGAFHAAHLLDWALSKGVPPRPSEIVLTLGHSPALPHIRFDYPFPWERERPFEIACGDLVVIPVMAYSISDTEAKLQHAQGAKTLEAHFEAHQTPLFDRARASSR